MEVSKLAIGWNWLCGFLNPFGSAMGNVVDYLLGVLANALDGLSAGAKDKIQSTLNVAQKVLSVLAVAKCFVPTKWQTAYAETVDAVSCVVDSLSDLAITREELSVVRDRFNAAVLAWSGPDDETCK